jgi:hypothetical protein
MDSTSDSDILSAEELEELLSELQNMIRDLEKVNESEKET